MDLLRAPALDPPKATWRLKIIKMAKIDVLARATSKFLRPSKIQNFDVLEPSSSPARFKIAALLIFTTFLEGFMSKMDLPRII